MMRTHSASLRVEGGGRGGDSGDNLISLGKGLISDHVSGRESLVASSLDFFEVEFLGKKQSTSRRRTMRLSARPGGNEQNHFLQTFPLRIKKERMSAPGFKQKKRRRGRDRLHFHLKRRKGSQNLVIESRRGRGAEEIGTGGGKSL